MINIDTKYYKYLKKKQFRKNEHHDNDDYHKRGVAHSKSLKQSSVLDIFVVILITSVKPNYVVNDYISPHFRSN